MRDRSDAPSAEGRADRVGGVFHHQEVRALGQLHEAIERRRVPGVIDGREHARPRRHGGRRLLRIEAERPLVDVGEHRPPPERQDGVGRGAEGERRGHHLAPRRHPRRRVGAVERRRAVRDHHGVGRAAGRGELGLERLGLGSGGEEIGSQDANHRGDVVVLDELPAVWKERLGHLANN